MATEIQPEAVTDTSAVAEGFDSFNVVYRRLGPPTTVCGCTLGKHHREGCERYVDVWRICPCPECTARRDATTPER